MARPGSFAALTLLGMAVLAQGAPPVWSKWRVAGGGADPSVSGPGVTWRSPARGAWRLTQRRGCCISATARASSAHSTPPMAK
ncbi:MAG: hypothetical protein J3K34DRAFT_520275 [Monoraphidium minutum]|nr:MAG: hypothetical protein J3K34DRAFT_520275 [Monoraphidium minutum]